MDLSLLKVGSRESGHKTPLLASLRIALHFLADTEQTR
jgi:hypothetical protein